MCQLWIDKGGKLKSQTYTCDALVPATPLHPISWQDTGPRDTQKPSKPLFWNLYVSKSTETLSYHPRSVSHTYRGEGLPTVARRFPLTRVFGARYNFSNSSGDIERLPAVLIFWSVSSWLSEGWKSRFAGPWTPSSWLVFFSISHIRLALEG